MGIGLPLTIVAGTLVGLLVFPDLNVWTAAALATILAPTDAALGLPVISNRQLPPKIRQGLNVESGLNDGVCVRCSSSSSPLAVTKEDAGHTGRYASPRGDRLRRPWGEWSPGLLGAWILRHARRPRGWATPRAGSRSSPVATAILAYTLAERARR